MIRILIKYYLPVLIIIFIAVIEGSLRLFIGLGNPALVQADSSTGYRFQPNQKVFRFGKKIEYNQYSQRSEPISLEKRQGKLRILAIGDSVLNGGAPTDQKQTITEILEAKLVAAGYPAEVLNASAGSWGIGNHQGYLRKFGTFNSDAVILEIGTNDLAQPTSSSDRVGHDPNYPNQRPPLAIAEAVTRYAWPQLSGLFGFSSGSAEIPTSFDPDRQFQQNLELLKTNVNLVRSRRQPVFVLFVPQLSNLVPTPSEPKYKSELLAFLKSLQVPVIDMQQAWSALPAATLKTYFRDNDHLTEAGNQAIANFLFEQLCVARQFTACSPQKASKF